MLWQGSDSRHFIVDQQRLDSSSIGFTANFRICSLIVILVSDKQKPL